MGEVCLALPGTTLDNPFGDDHDIYKVGGKMFAMVGAMGGLSFKVSDIAHAVPTEDGRARPVPYLARAKWVHLDDSADWHEDELVEHLASAHTIVAGKLTKKTRAELNLG